MKSTIIEDLQCNSVSGMIVHDDTRSWLSVINDIILIIVLQCVPQYIVTT